MGKVMGATTFGGPKDPGTGSQGYRGDNLAKNWKSYAELSPGGSGVSGAMGDLPYKHPVRVTNPQNGKSIVLRKRDVGKGGGSVSGAPRKIDLWYKAAQAIGLPESWSGKLVVSPVGKGEKDGKTSSVKAPVEKTVTPGVDNSQQRKVAMLDYIQNRNDPSSLLGLVSTLRGLKDVAPKTTTAPGTDSSMPHVPSVARRGKVVFAASADRAGSHTKREVKDFLSDAAGRAGGRIDVGTGTNHNQFVAGTSRQSDHWTGNAADLPAAGSKGDRIAESALESAGVSRSQARQMARKGGVFNIMAKKGPAKGRRVQILWKTNVGGNHYDHVHVGIR